MTRRYLFGPVTPEFAEQYLYRDRETMRCLAFNPAGTTDVAIGMTDSWDTICSRLPEGWRPDFVVLYLPYTTIPPALWTAPVPLVGWACDWNLLWHCYRHQLPRCELVLTDTPGVEMLRRQGMTHAHAANLFGLGRSFLEYPWPDGPRDLDVLFVGNCNPAVQRERQAWLGRIAQLSRRWKVAIRAGVFGDPYRQLLGRARVVFNRSIRGEANMRVFEAALAGALLFQEAENREVTNHFADRQECVLYHEDDLETLLEHYLNHEEERRAIAEAARAKAVRFAFADVWDSILQTVIEPEWTAIQDRMAKRRLLTGSESLLARTWQLHTSAEPADTGLIDDLKKATQEPSTSPAVYSALGLAITRLATGKGGPKAGAAIAAAEQFQRAVNRDPNDALAGLNLAEALAAAGQPAAIEQAKRTLTCLEEQPERDVADLQGGHFPAAFDLFGVEWERAVWENAGAPLAEARAKVALIRWRLHSLLAEFTGDGTHYYAAHMLRPDLPRTQAGLGCSLARSGQLDVAAGHLQRAVAGNPFDRPAARAYFQCLLDRGDQEGQLRVIEEQRCLAQAAPGLVPVERWFAEPDFRRAADRRLGSAPPRPGSSEVLRIVWEGSVSELKSLALVNRALCRKLIDRGHELSVVPPPIPQGNPVPLMSDIPDLAARIGQPLSGPADVHVRHDWPPDFTPPESGRWVLIQPWEFGSLPRSWVPPIREAIDEVWVYTHFVRGCYLRSGIPAERVHVIPLGVDPAVFRPEGSKKSVPTTKRFKFLFVGGTIARKGIDLLLKAYQQAFTAQDDVCLVIKDMGVGSFYRGQTAEPRISRLREQPNSPEVLYIDRPMAEEEVAGLYRACDCLVHPYRGEGFGLPIAEAMACGLPVIVTRYGAALDFCNDDNAFLIPAPVVCFSEKRVGDLETVDFPFWAEPDLAALKDQMRSVVGDPIKAQEKGRRAARHIHSNFTWDHAADAMSIRLRELAQKPVRRLSRTAAGPASLPPTPAWQGGRVSLCMIVKNEESNLPVCLACIADLVDEMVIVDTGSTDRTKELAAAAGAKVFDFPWIDSFAAARNESLRHATGDWIFWLDADDRIDEANRTRLKILFKGLRDEQAGYVMKCVCLPDPVHGTATVVDHVRLFRNHPAIRWEYRVHEQILPGVRRQGGEIRWSDVMIQHVGYQDPALRGRKLQRDLRLLDLENAEKPDDPFILFNLGAIYHELGQASQALVFLRRSLEHSQPTDSIVRKLYSLMVHCHRQMDQLEQAQAVCREGRRHYPEDAELLFHEGLIRRDRGDVEGAEGCLLRLVNSREAAHFASVDVGLRGYKARHNLAVIYQEQKRYGEAEAQWKAALAEKPDYTPSWTGLGDLYLIQGRWAEFEQTARQLQGVPRATLDADVLRARGHLARKEFDQARQLVESAIIQEPAALAPRRVLTHVLLQEGRDWAAAEKALHELIALAPEDKEAQHNLAVLKRQLDSGLA